MTSPTIVVLNMHYTGLAIARDLWQPGRQIVGLSSDTRFFGNYSKHVSFRLCPDTETAQDECKDFLLHLSGELDGTPLLLPTRDHDVHFIIRYRDELSRAFVIPYPESDVLNAIMDKTSLATIAQSVGIHCPSAVELNSVAEMDSLADRLVFPSVVKPVVAARWRRDGIRDVVGKQKAIRVGSYDELRELYERIAAVDPQVQVQEYIPGPETSLVVFGSCCDEQSDVVAHFTGRKLIQYPANAGTGVVVEAALVPDVVEASIGLLKRLQYIGISEIEYKYDADRSQYALIEINTRHWDQHGLGTAVGVNLSETLYAGLCGTPVQSGTQCAESVFWVAEDGFLVALLANLRRRAYPWSVFTGVLRSRKSLAVFRWKDPVPALRLLWSLVADVFARLFGRIARVFRSGPQ